MKKKLNCIDITKEYLDNATPQNGEISHDLGTDESDQKISEWLFRIFGGGIRTLKVENKNGQDLKTPDALWNGVYWEYKKVSSKRSVEDRIRSGWRQLRENAMRKSIADYPVGLLIDISNRTESIEETVICIERNFVEIIKNDADLIIKDNDEIVKIIRKKRG